MAAHCRSVLCKRGILLVLRDNTFKLSPKLGNVKYFHSTSNLGDRSEETVSERTNDEESISENGKVFGYIDGRRDKNTDGLLHLGMIKLPDELKETYKIFCKRYPKKSLTEDGQKIALHLRNRGRPTEQTWKKYKDSKAKVSVQVKQFPVGNDEEYPSDSTDDSVENEEDLQSTSEKASNEGQLLSSREVKKMSKAPKRAQYAVIRYGKREIAAFASSRIPACFGSTKRVLSEIARRDPEFSPKTLLDFGSGTGMAIWAAHDIWGKTLREYQCMDVSEDANNACEFLLRGNFTSFLLLIYG